MDFDGELNEIDGFGMWKLTWEIFGGSVEIKKIWTLCILFLDLF